MATTQLPKRPVENWEAVRDEWIAALDQFFSEVESWAAEQVDWPTKRLRKPVAEDRLGSFEVDQLLVHAPRGRLLFDPVARFVVGATGLIDFYVMPSLSGVSIVRTEHGWELHSDAAPGPREWSREAFLETAEALFDAA